jgi:hypothetical protein
VLFEQSRQAARVHAIEHFSLLLSFFAKKESKEIVV